MVMRTKSKWSPGLGVTGQDITLQDEDLGMVSAIAQPVCICPDCGKRSRHRHGWRSQSLSDLPIQERTVKVKLGLRRWQCRRSVANWLASSAPRDRKRAVLKTSSPLYFEGFLAACWKSGNRNGRHLFHDVRNRGYTGSRSNLERLLKEWRCSETRQHRDVTVDIPVSDPVRDPDTGHKISADIAAALCMKPRGKLSER